MDEPYCKQTLPYNAADSEGCCAISVARSLGSAFCTRHTDSLQAWCWTCITLTETYEYTLTIYNTILVFIMNCYIAFYVFLHIFERHNAEQGELF